MRSGRAVELQAPEAILEVSCISEGERLGDLDDQAALDEFQLFRIVFCVLESVCPGEAAEDLDARACGVADDGEEREADAYGDAKLEGIEDGGGEDYHHEAELGIAANADEEEDVMRGFFNE